MVAGKRTTTKKTEKQISKKAEQKEFNKRMDIEEDHTEYEEQVKQS
jgi:hypothetical protein